MDADYLWHVTLTTGHATAQTRGARDDAALARIAGLLDEALAGGEPEVVTGYTMRASARGSNLIATLHAGNALVLTTGVALRSRLAPDLWRHLHDTADPDLGPLVTSRDKVPPAPWIADRIERGLALAVQVAARDQDWLGVPVWTGAWAALTGWAWLERDR